MLHNSTFMVLRYNLQLHCCRKMQWLIWARWIVPPNIVMKNIWLEILFKASLAITMSQKWVKLLSLLSPLLQFSVFHFPSMRLLEDDTTHLLPQPHTFRNNNLTNPSNPSFSLIAYIRSILPSVFMYRYTDERCNAGHPLVVHSEPLGVHDPHVPRRIVVVPLVPLSVCQVLKAIGLARLNESVQLAREPFQGLATFGPG